MGWRKTSRDFIILTLTDCLVLELSIQYLQTAESKTAKKELLLTGETGGQLGDPQLKQLPKDTILRVHLTKFCLN